MKNWFHKLLLKYNAALAFILVGILSSSAYMLILVLLSGKFDWGSTPSIAVAYTIGTVVSYLGSARMAFQKKMTTSNSIKFLIIVGLSFSINVITSEVLSPLGVKTISIGLINIIFSGVFNYLCHKYWTFS